MAASYTTPGVYVEEVVSKSATLSPGATAVAAFIGFTERAPNENPNEPKLVTNWSQYEKLYGGFTNDTMLAHSVYGYFLNGGSVAYIVRIPHRAPAEKSGQLELKSGDKGITAPGQTDIKASVRFTTKEPNAPVTVQITKEEPSAPEPAPEPSADPDDNVQPSADPDDNVQPSADPDDNVQPPAAPDSSSGTTGTQDPPAPSYTIVITEAPKKHGEKPTKETFTGVLLSTIAERLNGAETISNSPVGGAGTTSGSSADGENSAVSTTEGPLLSELVTVTNEYEDAILDTARFSPLLHTLEVGEHVIVPAVGEKLDKVSAQSFNGSESSRTGIEGLTIAEDVTMLIVPDLITAADLGNEKYDHNLWKTVQLALINHCEGVGNRMAILDPPPDIKTPQAVKKWRNDSMYASAYGALYYPWIEVTNPAAKDDDPPNIKVPPSGHMAGIWARTDDTRGVWKAPANEVVRGALSVETPVTGGEQGLLNPIGINCIRPFGTQGIRVWGARTLAPPTGDWVYINVRRLFNMIEDTILNGTQYAVFEPNDQELWEGLKRTIGSLLRGLWRDGALFGATAEQAYYVKCDEETNPQDSIDQGRVIVEVGIAPVKPAEFVIFRIAQIKPES